MQWQWRRDMRHVLMRCTFRNTELKVLGRQSPGKGITSTKRHSSIEKKLRVVFTASRADDHRFKLHGWFTWIADCGDGTSLE